MKYVYSFVLFSFLFLVTTQIKAQDYSHEVNGEVKELADFHEVIYPIWHTAYPEKDYAALRSYVGDVNKYANKIYEVKLTGILQDKTAKWEEGVGVFKNSVDNYNKAAEGKDDAALLNAAEKMHSDYENLVRIIRPVLKEVDAFHKELYVIYHKYLPDGNYEKIKEVAPLMLEKAKAIKTAKLNKKMESKKDAFNKAADELIASTEVLNKATKETYKDDVEKMHRSYQNLEKIFE